MDKQAIIEQLKKDEGFSAKSFWDIKQWTWGYGTKAPSGPGLSITKEVAEIALSKRVDQAIQEFSVIFANTTTPINAVREHALVNMIYNLGMGGVLGFKNMLKNINAGDWKAAAESARSSLWYRQVTSRARRICLELQEGVTR